MKLLGKIFLRAFAVIFSAYLLPGVHLESFVTAIIVAAVLGLLNLFVRPVFILFTIPFTIITFGLFLFVINAIIIKLADSLIDGFSVDGFFWAILFSLILSFVTTFLEGFSSDKKEN